MVTGPRSGQYVMVTSKSFHDQIGGQLLLGLRSRQAGWTPHENLLG